MELLRSDKDRFDTKEIEQWIELYENQYVKGAEGYANLWQYFLGNNPPILARQDPEPGNPGNKTPVAYGRKIVNTFTGYAYRPGYIRYSSDDNEAYMADMQRVFDDNQEPIMTQRAGRNTGIYGLAYELMYVEGVDSNSTDELTLLLTFGTETIATGAALDVADNNLWYVDCYVTINTAGSGGKIAAIGQTTWGAPGTATPTPFIKAEASEDLSGSVAVAINADWSVAHADNECHLQSLVVEIL